MEEGKSHRSNRELRVEPGATGNERDPSFVTQKLPFGTLIFKLIIKKQKTQSL